MAQLTGTLNLKGEDVAEYVIIMTTDKFLMIEVMIPFPPYSVYEVNSPYFDSQKCVRILPDSNEYCLSPGIWEEIYRLAEKHL